MTVTVYGMKNGEYTHTDRGCDGGCIYDEKLYKRIMQILDERIKPLPSAQPEPAIPLSWIEGQIEWLKSLDNAFSTLTAGQILAMMNKWKDEQNERSKYER